MGYISNRGLAALAGMLVLVVGLATGPARAQDEAWVQLESFASLTNAEQRLRAYAQLVENVNGLRTADGAYAIAVGPFAAGAARPALAQLQAQGVVPPDSFVADSTRYVSQFFPVGSTALADAAAAAAVVPDETPQEARRSEAQLNREQRDALQIALQWFGFYTSAIDGAFGPGTRGAMSAWQEDRGLEATGVLTTRQRAQLLNEYQGELAALGMETIQDTQAGIEVDLPMAMVGAPTYNFPFAQYGEIDDSGVQVLLISQPGDETTLFGLYEIMQTLEIVPLDGERTRRRDGFLLTGQSDTLRSHTEARLVRGAVKGFTLVWPPERDEQIARVLPMMQNSINYIDGVLDPGAIPDGVEDGVDMVSGLEVRQPDLVRSGFYLDRNGAVMTTTDVLGECAELLINNVYPAEVALSDEALGFVVLRPLQQLAPMRFAQLSEAPGRIRAEIAVSGFPFDGALSAASTSFGSLADVQGMNGETTQQRLDLRTNDSEAGGPVLASNGAVLGMVLPSMISGRALPEDVTLALRTDAVLEALTTAGFAPEVAESGATINDENLARLGADMTVTVSCWN